MFRRTINCCLLVAVSITNVLYFTNTLETIDRQRKYIENYSYIKPYKGYTLKPINNTWKHEPMQSFIVI